LDDFRDTAQTKIRIPFLKIHGSESSLTTPAYPLLPIPAYVDGCKIPPLADGT
jgi:hypothetical protein